MRIKPSILINGISGKISGGVVSKSGVGRGFAVPKNPRSASQGDVRADFTTQSRAWGSLTEAQRVAWNKAAANSVYTDVFGDKHQLSGKGYFTQLNLNITKANGTAITSPPTLGTVAAPLTAAFGSNTNAAQTITWTGGAVAANTAFVIEETPSQSVGTMKAQDSKFRVVSTQAAAASSPANIFAAVVSVNGTPTTGKKVFGRIYAVNLLTGQVSTAISFSGITA
jgi:hypothetical protein